MRTSGLGRVTPRERDYIRLHLGVPVGTSLRTTQGMGYVRLRLAQRPSWDAMSCPARCDLDYSMRFLHCNLPSHCHGYLAQTTAHRHT